MDKFLKYRLLISLIIIFTFIFVVIYFGLITPKEFDEKKFTLIDKILHLITYFSFSILLFFLNPNKKYIIFFVFLIFGIGFEFIQPFFQRNFQYLDIISNFLGLCVSLIISKKYLINEKNN